MPIKGLLGAKMALNVQTVRLSNYIDPQHRLNYAQKSGKNCVIFGGPSKKKQKQKKSRNIKKVVVNVKS